MLQTFVKVSQVSNLSDARYCAGMGVDQLGANLQPDTPGYVSPEKFKEVMGWVSGIRWVGEFGIVPGAFILEQLRHYPVDVIETSNLDAIEGMSLMHKPLQFRLTILEEKDINQHFGSTLSYLDELVDRVIVVCPNPSLWAEVDRKAAFYSGKPHLIKSYDITTANVTRPSGFKGIELFGSEEERPGFQDYGELMEILEVLEVE
jgi:phosphoribosylanthranilate isomerase